MNSSEMGEYEVTKKKTGWWWGGGPEVVSWEPNIFASDQAFLQPKSPLDIIFFLFRLPVSVAIWGSGRALKSINCIKLPVFFLFFVSSLLL